MSVITRKEKFMAAAATGDVSGLPAPLTRQEAYLLQIAKGKTDRFLDPVTRREGYLHAICVGRTDGLPRPVTREERFLYAAAIGDAEGVPDPVTRTEICLKAIAEGSGGGGGVVTEGEFGVEWDYSSPSPALTRTGDAVGFADPVPATTLTEVGTSPFDNIMPWAGMRMCNIIDGQVEYWQGDPQFSETDYDTMVYIPEFWYKAEKNTNTSKWRWSISPSEKEGYAKHPGSGRYIGRFHSSGSSAGVYSKSDAMPFVGTTRPNFRTYSHNKGTKWWQLDIATWSAVQLLYLVEYANFNNQIKTGYGQDSGSLERTGGTDGAVYHTVKRSRETNQYRWIENPASNAYTFVDGVVASSKKVYIGTNNAAFTDTTSSLESSEITLPASGYITGLGFSSKFPWAFIPNAATDGTYLTYVTDRVNSAVGTCVLITGGNSTYSVSSYGLFYFHAGLDASNIGNSPGSRLIYIP